MIVGVERLSMPVRSGGIIRDGDIAIAHRTAIEKIGAEAARIDACHLDPEGRHLAAQRFGPTGHGMLVAQ